MGVSFKSGRYFSHEFGSNSKKACILNETAVKQFGIQDAVGKQMASQYDIIRVVKDFNLHSFHSETPPLMITVTDMYIKQIAVHYKEGTMDIPLPKIKNSWKTICEDQVFTYTRIEIQWWFFVMAFLISVLAVSITVLIQLYRVAKLNPIDAIKCE